MKFVQTVLLSVVATALVGGQTATQVDLRTQAKSVDFSSAIATKPLKSGSVLPAACSVGEMYYKTDAPAGGNVYGCVALNTWALQSGGVLGGDVSGSASAATVTQIQGRAIAATAPTGGQALTWNGSTSRWEPQTVSGGSGNATQLQGRNVATVTPGDTNVLCWSTTNSWWGPCASGGITNPFTFPGKFTAAASGVGAASFAIPAGVAPSTPSAGDVWNVAGALQFHNGSAAKTIAFVDSSITGTAAGITGKSAQGNGSLLLLGSGAYAAGNVTSIDANGNVVDGGLAVANIVRTGGTYADPGWITSLAKAKVGLGNVENTALSGWGGSSAITTVGTVGSGTWQGAAIGAPYIGDLSGSYQAVSGKNAASGYAGLDGASRIAKAQAPSATVYTDGSYPDPAWITSLSASKVGNGTAQWNANRINGTVLSGLTTGLLKNTTGSGAASIAIGTGAAASADYIAPSILTTSQDILYRNGTDLARLPIVSLNKCLGNSGGLWAAMDCSGGSGGVGDPGGNGLVVRTALNTTTNRSIAPGAGILVSNADGQAGNPTVSADTAVVLTRNVNQSGVDLYVSDTSGNATYAGCPAAHTVTGYTNGMVIWFRPNTSATTTATLNLCSLGTKPIYQADGATNPGSQMGSNKFYALVYDATLGAGAGAFRMLQGDSAVGGSYVPTSRTVNGHALSADVNVTAGDVGNGTAQWNANQLQGRAMASTAPSDTNVICWDSAASTWKPCAAGGGGGAGFPGTATALTLDHTGTPSADRAFTPRYGLAGTDGGAQSTYTLDSGIDARKMKLEERFCGGQIGVGSGNIGELGWTYGGEAGGNGAKANGDYPTPCGYTIQSGTTVGNGARVKLENTFGALGNHTDVPWHLVFRFSLNATSTAVMSCGLMDNTNMYLNTGFYIRYSTNASDTNFMFVSSNVGNPTASSTGIAADTAIHSLHIYGNGANNNRIYFQLDGGTAKSFCASGCDVTAPISTSVMYPMCTTQLGAGGTASRDVNIWYFGFEMPLGTGASRFN